MGASGRVRAIVAALSVFVIGLGLSGCEEDVAVESSLAELGVLSATPGDGEVTLRWNPIEGALGYNLYWSVTPGVTKENGTLVANVTSPYVHSGLINGTTYYYVGTAYNEAAESPESAEVSATPGPPGAPMGVSFAPGSRQLTISWASVSGATSYNLYWSASPGVTTATGTKIVAVTAPYVHTGLTNAVVYYYVVTAVNEVGESPPSAEVQAEAGLFLNEAFTDNSSGWTLGDEWQIGSATAASCNSPTADPGTDTTPTADNGIAGIVIGGCYALTPNPSAFTYLTSPVIDASSLMGATLQLDFQRWLTSDYPPSFAKNQVEVWDGVGWVAIWVQADGADPSDVVWSNQVFDITAYSNANLQVRFGFSRLGNSGLYPNGGWNLDDIVIRALP